MRLFIILAALFLGVALGARDPTLYEHYTSGGIKSGLEANHADHFVLNGKPFIIYSGSFHYFRVVPQHWREILQRFKAAGLNAVQLYLPWNLHEEIPGHFEFESAGLNLAKFLEEIKLADMFAIVRPGPYICAEWEMGGFPSWLLRDPHMKLRSNYKPYLERVKFFWDRAMKIINKYQFTTSGGPVIFLQTENEYSPGIHHPESDEYLNYLVKEVRDSGFKELIFNSDPGSTAQGYPIKDIYKDHSILQTANLNLNALKTLNELKKNQPGKPAFISEFWPGYFDNWYNRQHKRYSTDLFDHEVSDTLFKANGSLNFYMFIGGTNFGFTNGGGVTTSYDYDAPLSEAGNYTAKYHKTRELYLQLVASGRLPKTHLPEIPPAPKATAYGKVQIEKMLNLEALLQARATYKFTNMTSPVPMELLNIGQDYGKRFGFILYRVETQTPKTYKIPGAINDHAIYLTNGEEEYVMENGGHNFENNRRDTHVTRHDLLVENGGRVNSGDGMNHARKGILGDDILLNDVPVKNITIFSLDFNRTYMSHLETLTEWKVFEVTKVGKAPAMYRTHLKIDQTKPESTYLLMDGWTKGNVFVNGFNLGRYWKVGPTKTLYVPGPILKTGLNTIDVFEQHTPGHELNFIDHPLLE